MKEYIGAQIEVIEFDSEDVITTSPTSNMTNGGGSMPTGGAGGGQVGF